jgi:phosphopantothenoylcysteine decarboxylase/phosphopantothenate--cysteine ligase
MLNQPLKNKKIILGVTGGIAAYKSVLILRELVELGAEVKVVMTPSALEFITPLTLSALSGNEVIVNVFPESQKNGVKAGTWHIDLGIWADLMIIAPCTTNTTAKIANGFSDNALTTLACALRAPLLIAPAADMDMYESDAHKKNLGILESRGVYIVDAEVGFLASGLKGKGRMAEVRKIIDASELVLSVNNLGLTGKKILVTAGPTYEDLDPVRFIGNRSSGKMGAEIAKAAFLMGADVNLILGPVDINVYPEIKVTKVRSAIEMKSALENQINDFDVLIMSAAVSDYKPYTKAENKIKKSDNPKEIKLTKNPDILAGIANNKIKKIGFALETDNELSNASHKLEKKNLDMIVLNKLSEDGAGFELDTNKITIISRNKDVKEFPLQSKFQTAISILEELKNLFD